MPEVSRMNSRSESIDDPTGSANSTETLIRCFSTQRQWTIWLHYTIFKNRLEYEGVHPESLGNSEL